MHAGVAPGGSDELGKRRQLRRGRRRFQGNEQCKSDEGDRTRRPGRSAGARERGSYASRLH